MKINPGLNSLIYKLEQHSSHPIAKSIVAELETLEKKNSIPKFVKIEEQKGFGIIATAENGAEFKIGSSLHANQFSKEVAHDVYLLENDKILATIDIGDSIKASASATINYLKTQGIQSIILSGDKKRKIGGNRSSVGY